MVQEIPQLGSRKIPQKIPYLDYSISCGIYDAAVTRHLGGRNNAMGSVVGEVGGHALEDALAACMFGEDTVVQHCHGRGWWCGGRRGGYVSWAAAFEGDVAVQQAMLSGKRGAVQWITWGLWATALGGNVAMQLAVLLGGGGRGVSQANRPYLCSWALNAWEKKEWYGFW